MTTNRKLDYLKRATDVLYRMRQAPYTHQARNLAFDCGMLAQVLDELAQLAGITGVQRAAGEVDLRSNHPRERGQADWIEHVWLTVDGLIFDPKVWALRGRRWHPLAFEYRPYSPDTAADLIEDLSFGAAAPLASAVLTRVGVP